MHLSQAESLLDSKSSPAFCAGRKIGEIEKAQLWNWLKEEPENPSRIFQEKFAQREEPLSISVRQINRLRVEWGLNRKQGRPCRVQFAKLSPSSGGVVQVAPRLSFAGVHIFADWMEQQEKWGPVLARLQQEIEAYRRAHPQKDFPLLHHKEQTLRRRFKALFFCTPVWGQEANGIRHERTSA
jgi:hypothetical protein